ncbi:hypothetical protein BYT27DRAFT_7203059 [Phlegmacium glaucopus]|nr:hypothetical protein BYT27DRAFT_7203059 [Phlegmacium glaucopus]
MVAMDAIGTISSDRSQHNISPSWGALCHVDCDLGSSLEVDPDVVQPFPDTQGQSRTTSRRRIAHPKA